MNEKPFIITVFVIFLAVLWIVHCFFSSSTIREVNLEGQCNIQLQEVPVLPVDKTIFGLEVALPIEEVHQYLNYKRARGCLQNKKLLLLGDSTMTELADDLILLLANTNRESLESYIYDRCTPGVYTLKSRDSTRTVVERTLPLKAHRHLSAHCDASNTSIRLHYTGHYNIFENRYGIRTFFHPQFTRIFEEYLAWKPDIIIVNSGLHDVSTTSDTFQRNVRRLADKLEKTGARVFWKGSIWLPVDIDDVPSKEKLLYFDSLAREEFLSRNLSYVDVAHVMQQIYCSPVMRESDLRVVGDMIHYGEEFHRKYIHTTTLFQAYTTQAVFNAVCF